MADPMEAERIVLENWKRERAELDAAIEVLERKIAARTGSNPSSANMGTVIGPDEFFRMSTPDAIKKFLKIVGKPARAATDIVDGLKRGGSNTANYTNVYTALGRLKVKGEVVKVGENWGLDEWYPPASGRESKGTMAGVGALSNEELIESAEKFIEESKPDNQEKS
jgi:hypothetical protein